MPIRDYYDELLAKADDAAARAKWAGDPLVKAAWQRIEMRYRETAISPDVPSSNSVVRPDRRQAT